MFSAAPVCVVSSLHSVLCAALKFHLKFELTFKDDYTGQRLIVQRALALHERIVERSVKADFNSK